MAAVRYSGRSDLAQAIGRNRTDERLDLLGPKEAHAAVGRAGAPRTVHERDRVHGGELALDREGEDPVQEVEEVLDRLGRQARLALVVHERLDAGAVDLVERPRSEEGHEMAAQVAR